MPKTIIETEYERQSVLIKYLEAQNETSFATDAKANLTKNLILGTASYYETVICELIRDVAKRYSGDNEYICTLVEQKAIKRQYHTFFNWDGNNANQFFALFGEAFSAKARTSARENRELDEGIKAFLRLGNLRNELVHINFLTYEVKQIPEDVIDLYRKAERFIEFLRVNLLPALPAAEGPAQASAAPNAAGEGW